MTVDNRRIGIFAGTFDPIHDGHIDIARSAVEHLELEELLILVEESPWGDKSPIDIAHRKEMVELSISSEGKINQLVMDQKRFNIDETLPDLETRFAGCELYFIFGGDIFMHMNEDSWSGLEGLLRHYIVVFERGNVNERDISEHAKSLGIVAAILPNEKLDHSSTDVRLKPHNKAIWIPKSVAGYIDQNSLY
ncbi:MAG: nicotinate-nucleotide adenylyltransferase [Candidatus Saccharimonadales bacterium]|jgi:nicotinate-nucleotide adenylyltransferase